MDQFQSTFSGAGLLKADYDDGDHNPVSAALRKRAARLRDKTEPKIADTLNEETKNV